MQLEIPKDTELIINFQQSGDPACLNELFLRYVDKVTAMVNQIVLNSADAADVTQDAFVKAARSLPRFRQDATFSTWLFRIAMNTAKDFLRKKGRRQETGGMEIQDSIPALDPRPDESARLAELDSLITQSMAELRPHLRVALVLVVMEQMSPEDAAEIEGVKVSTLYWRIHQARKELKGKLAVYYEA